MQGAVVTVVDLPAGNSRVAVTNVFACAQKVGVTRRQSLLRELACVDLLLNEERDEVDKE